LPYFDSVLIAVCLLFDSVLISPTVVLRFNFIRPSQLIIASIRTATFSNYLVQHCSPALL
jgi:hypothetical protein